MGARMNEISKYYTPTGSELIEWFYSDDYLSIGGKDSTETLATMAGVSQDTSVLDIGSGLGGPAMYIAETRGCKVMGLDIVDSNVKTARSRAKVRSLQNLVTFQLGDAMDMPFPTDSFNVIIGQDAWSHVPDKDKLISECARVIELGGTIAFTDWLDIGGMQGDYRASVLDAIAATTLSDQKKYITSLVHHGFEIVIQEDISAHFKVQYDAVITRLEGQKERISERYSPKLYAIVHKKNECIRRAFSDGMLGGGRIVAKRL
tara:strand:+ start:237 stop:1019 length:783 start_codon:yes stop_codon:yes gene_type:complete